MRILVVGAGGLGGYFGARWAAAGLDVTLLARGRQLEAIRRHGLTVKSPLGDVTVEISATDNVRDVSDIGDLDLVLFATKSWQLPEAVASVSAALSPKTCVLGVQNGVETIATLQSTFPAASVLGGTCRIISLIEAPGVIRHVGVAPSILFGELNGGRSERVAQLETALHLGEPLTFAASADIQLEIWRKFLFFAPVSGVGSVARGPIGVLRSIAESRRLLESAVEEVFAIARAEGVQLTEEMAAHAITFLDTLPPEGTSSMQRDFEAGRPSELEALAGAVVRMGQRLEIATPTHAFIYASLKPLEARARGDIEWPEPS